MPTVREIEQCLFDLAPREGAMAWDNVGQLLGDPERQVSRVLVALDITEDVADEAVAAGCELIVSHHPVMNCKWLPVQTVRSDTPQGHLLLKLLTNGVAAVCMHTNLDVAKGGVNDCLAETLRLIDPGPLGDPEGLCRMGTLESPMPLQSFAAFVCKALGCNGVRYADAGKPSAGWRWAAAPARSTSASLSTPGATPSSLRILPTTPSWTRRGRASTSLTRVISQRKTRSAKRSFPI